MKNKIYIVILLACFNYGNSQTTTIVFMDKSSSLHTDDELLAKKTKILEGVFREGIKNEGDQIVLSYIFSNTASPSNAHYFSYEPPEPLDMKMTKMEKEIAHVEHEQQKRRYKKNLRKSFIDKALKYENSNTGTSVFGCFPIIQTVVERNRNSKVSVYIFSDLEECSEFQNLYCKGANTFASYDQAQEMACSDLERAKEVFQVDSDLLSKLKSIKVFLPSKDLSEKKSFVYLPKYWAKIFEGLGANQISFQ